MAVCGLQLLGDTMSIEALYEIKRQGLLLGFISNPDKFDPALAYAHQHRLSPIFNEEILREAYGQDPFEQAYWIKSSFVDDVTKYIDELFRKKDYAGLAFNEIEDRFGGYKAKRMELRAVIEYARIKGLFDDAVYGAIEKDAPIEVAPISSSFSAKDVYFG